MSESDYDIALVFQAENGRKPFPAGVEIRLTFPGPARADVLINRVKKASISHDPAITGTPWIVRIGSDRTLCFASLESVMRGRWWGEICKIAPKLSSPVVRYEPDHRRR